MYKYVKEWLVKKTTVDTSDIEDNTPIRRDCLGSNSEPYPF